MGAGDVDIVLGNRHGKVGSTTSLVVIGKAALHATAKIRNQTQT